MRKYRVTKPSLYRRTHGRGCCCRKIIQLRRVSKGRKEFHFHTTCWYKCYKSSLGRLAAIIAPELREKGERGISLREAVSVSGESGPSLPQPHTHTPPHTLQSILLQEIFCTCLRCVLGHSEGHFAAVSDGVEPSGAPPPLAASSVESRKADVDAHLSSFISGGAKKSLYDDFA